MKLWKVVQPQVQLMSSNIKYEVPILWFFQVQIITNIIYYRVVYNGNVKHIFTVCHSRQINVATWSLVLPIDIENKSTIESINIPSCLWYKARLIIETRFENSTVGRSKLGVRLILEVWGIAIWNTTLDIGVFWQWAIIDGVVVKPYFKGTQPAKRIKRAVHFTITLFWIYWTINRRQINSIWRYL